jgi:multidrug resistance protein MdtO
MKYTFHIVDVFSSTPFGGNRLAVLPDAKDWPDINTAITTCFLTALSTVGSSHQKQILRISGAIIGVMLGFGSQIFILPHLDSIAGFALRFLAVTIPAA